MSQPLQVTFWDVGQGDCSTITLPDGSIIIIDTGPRGSPIIDWLNDNPKEIHSLVLTHNDADHVGSLPALIGGFKHRIKSLFMLVDRPVGDRIFEKIFRCAYEGEALKCYKIQRLEIGAVIWSDKQLAAELRVVYPSFSGNVTASSPNSASGVICLFVNDRMQVVWPGDSTLKRVAEEVGGSKPHVMFGPHHGAPADFRSSDALNSLGKIDSDFAFISAATKNKYMHPRPGYLKRLELSGCQVRCSQLTMACDRSAVLNGKPVMMNHLVLGLRPPRNRGIACRGIWQLTWDGNAFVSDGFDDEHLKRVSGLHRPQCLKGRSAFEKQNVMSANSAKFVKRR